MVSSVYFLQFMYYYQGLKIAISLFPFVLFFFFISRHCYCCEISRQIPSQSEVEEKPFVLLSHVSNLVLYGRPMYHDWLKRVTPFRYPIRSQITSHNQLCLAHLHFHALLKLYVDAAAFCGESVFYSGILSAIMQEWVIF